jgi:outer membrane protein assembly factor BamA
MRTHRLALVLFIFCLLPLAAQTRSPIPQNQSKPAVRKVVFESAALVSSDEKNEISKEILAKDEPGFERTLADLIDEAGFRVFHIYQHYGYYMADVTADPKAVPGIKNTVDVVVRVNDPGRKFVFRGIRWSGTTIFSEQQLNETMAIQPGEIFDRDKFVKGLEELRRLYGSKGYVQYTAFPDTDINQIEGTIRIRMDVDEGEQFRFGHLFIAGLDDEHSRQLHDAWEGLRGQPYSHEQAEKLLVRMLHPVEKGITLDDYSDRKYDMKNHVVDYFVGFIARPPHIAQR